jgi:hypothetical protein
MGAAVVPFQDGQRLAVIGGSDGSQVFREVLMFTFNGTTYSPATASVLLRQGRRDAVAAAFNDGKKLLVLGGYSTAETPDENARPVAASEVLELNPEAPSLSIGPAIVGRGNLCAVSLPGGRVFTAGGRRQGESGLSSSGVAELITPTQNLTGGVLGMMPITPPRYLHTCTLLPDGSVLIIGGLDEGGGSTQVATGIYLFMPVPRD